MGRGRRKLVILTGNPAHILLVLQPMKPSLTFTRFNYFSCLTHKECKMKFESKRNCSLPSSEENLLFVDLTKRHTLLFQNYH